MRVRVTNPPSGGSASAIRITTYQTSAKSKIVDQDSTTAVISVSGTGKLGIGWGVVVDIMG